MKRSTNGRSVPTLLAIVASLFVMIASLPTSSSAAGRSPGNTRPLLGPAGPSGTIEPSHVDRKTNVNVSNKAGYQGETAVAVDPTDPKHILAASNDLSGQLAAQVYESLDAGKTWANANVGLTTLCYDPWLDFNAAGDAFFSYECSNESYAYRLHGTTTWVKTTFPPSLVGSAPDRDMIVVDTTPTSPFFNSVYVGYDDNGSGNAAYVLYSRTGTKNWKRGPKINDAGSTIGVNVSVSPSGTLSASWLDYPSSRIMMDRSTDGGVTWGIDRVVVQLKQNTSGFFVPIPPQQSRGIVLMPFTRASTPHAQFPGRVYVAYEDRANAGKPQLDVFVVWTDDGQIFSAPVRVNNDKRRRGAYQFFPAIAVRPDGAVAVTFYDTRNDPLHHKTQVFIATSRQNGTRFTRNVRISTGQSDETVNGSDPNQYGDYEGLDAGPTGVFAAVWCDSRPGNMNEDLYFQRYPTRLS